VEKGLVRLHPNEILTKRDEHRQEQNAIGKVVNIEPALEVVDEDHNHLCQRLPYPNLCPYFGFLGLNHLPHRSHQALHHYQEQYGRPWKRFRIGYRPQQCLHQGLQTISRTTPVFLHRSHVNSLCWT